jgi:hypothetical protein
MFSKGNDMRVYLQPAFLLCVLILVAAGSSMSIAIKSFGVYLKKEPLPIKKSLEFLDECDLAPYRVVLPKLKIENEEVLAALGTEDYIQWIVEDTEASADSAVKMFMLFVTYYQLPDRVPHVPEECYAGGGYQKLASDSITLEVDNKSGFKKVIRGKYLVFGGTKANLWRSSKKFPVLYLFRVNGEYAGSREEARLTLNKNLFHKHSYFSKVEIVFNQSSVEVSKADAIAASEKLLAAILPVLEQEHWPEWQD